MISHHLETHSHAEADTAGDRMHPPSASVSVDSRLTFSHNQNVYVLNCKQRSTVKYANIQLYLFCDEC